MVTSKPNNPHDERIRERQIADVLYANLWPLLIKIGYPNSTVQRIFSELAKDLNKNLKRATLPIIVTEFNVYSAIFRAMFKHDELTRKQLEFNRHPDSKIKSILKKLFYKKLQPVDELVNITVRIAPRLYNIANY